MGVGPFILGVVLGGVVVLIMAIASFDAEWDCTKYGFVGETPYRQEQCIQLGRKE